MESTNSLIHQQRKYAVIYEHRDNTKKRLTEEMRTAHRKADFQIPLRTAIDLSSFLGFLFHLGFLSQFFT